MVRLIPAGDSPDTFNSTSLACSTDPTDIIFIQHNMDRVEDLLILPFFGSGPIISAGSELTLAAEHPAYVTTGPPPVRCLAQASRICAGVMPFLSPMLLRMGSSGPPLKCVMGASEVKGEMAISYLEQVEAICTIRWS